MGNISNELTKEQAYLAYTTYSESVGSPVVTFDEFTVADVVAWQSIANVFWSFWSKPACADQEAA